jgi:hypothetical protein
MKSAVGELRLNELDAIEFGEGICRGNFRDCFVLQGHPDYCVKRLRAYPGFLQKWRFFYCGLE